MTKTKTDSTATTLSGGIHLDDSHFIGNGVHKKCYIHPDNSLLCIKILYKEDKGAQKQLKREIKYNKKLKDKDIPFLPKYHGVIATNIGKGYQFDFIKNYDGSQSHSLSDYLSSETLLRDNFSMLVEALKRLKQHMFFYNVATMNIYPQNILYKKESEKEGKFIIIDDIGTASLIPLEYYFPFAAKARVKRRWHRLISYMEYTYKDSLAKELIKSVR
ncbi:MAG: hypothetical protein LBQ18_06215 [Campylobacteraceae bacterium]|nr:hypothetical protein [Campylobacteraceae bacterium]